MPAVCDSKENMVLLQCHTGFPYDVICYFFSSGACTAVLARQAAMAAMAAMAAKAVLSKDSQEEAGYSQEVHSKVRDNRRVRQIRK